jgi:DNA-binding CsgD family transcriptional regulator
MNKKYQVMPDLSPERYQELKDSITKNGILIPIEIDENGNIIDGYHRSQIAKELGIECPSNTKHYKNENAKFEAAITLNADRRGGLSREEKQELIKRYIKASPNKSSRQIADILKVDHKTVETQKKMLESVGEIPRQETIQTKDGKTRSRIESKPLRKEPATSNITKSIPYEIMELDIQPEVDASKTIKNACDTVLDSLTNTLLHNIQGEGQGQKNMELPIEKDMIRALNASELYSDLLLSHYMDVSILQTIGYLHCKTNGISTDKLMDLSPLPLKDKAILAFIDAVRTEARHSVLMESEREQSELYEKEKLEVKRYSCFAALIANYFREIFNENIVDCVNFKEGE